MRTSTIENELEGTFNYIKDLKKKIKDRKQDFFKKNVNGNDCIDRSKTPLRNYGFY